MKKVKVYVKQNNGIAFTTEYIYSVDMTKEEILERKDRLINKAKENYPNAEIIEVLIPIKNPQISKEKLMQIGQEVASVWGGVCTNIKTYESLVQFFCVEYGEKFDTFMTYEEIRKEYSRLCMN